MSEEIILLNDQAIKSKLDYKLQLELSAKIAGTLKKLTITNAETLTIATSTLGTAATFVEKIKTAIKDLKDPFQKKIDEIDAIGKEMITAIEEQIVNSKRDITLYKTTSIANATVMYNKTIEENEVKAEQIRTNFEVVKRVANQMLARVFGGSFTKKDGTTVAMASPTLMSEVKTQVEFIKANAPVAGPNVAPFESIAENMKKTILTSSALLEEKLTEIMNCSDAFQRAGIEKQISLLRTNTEIKLNEDLKSGEKYITTHLKTLNKEASNVIKAVSKGTRKSIIYCVDDIKVVPIEYLVVNNDIIKQFQKEHKDEIEKGIQLIPGITFSLSSTAVIRKE